jgi:hypothetical protein
MSASTIDTDTPGPSPRPHPMPYCQTPIGPSSSSPSSCPMPMPRHGPQPSSPFNARPQPLPSLHLVIANIYAGRPHQQIRSNKWINLPAANDKRQPTKLKEERTVLRKNRRDWLYVDCTKYNNILQPVCTSTAKQWGTTSKCTTFEVYKDKKEQIR